MGREAKLEGTLDRPWLALYEPGVAADIENELDHLGFRSLADFADHVFLKFKSKPALHCMGRTLTYADLDRLSASFASYIQRNTDLKPGDRIALMMPNILQYPIAIYGCLRAGLVVVNVNPLYTARELQYQMKDSGARAIVIFDNAADRLEQVLAETDIRYIFKTGIGDLLGFPKSFLIHMVLKYVKKMIPKYNLPGAIDFRKTLNASETFKKISEVTLDDLAFLQYTGGTTGVSKGAMLTHRNMLANITQAKAWVRTLSSEGEDIIITALPLYHIFSLTANCFTYSALGALNVLITNPRDIAGFIKEMKKWKFTAITAVNTLFNALLNHPEIGTVDFSKLRMTLGGGMAVQKSVAEKWKRITGAKLIEAYGLTETSPAACINPANIPEFNGYIGIPIGSTYVEIKDEHEVRVPFNEVGEICIKGPQVMKGYWQRPDETKQVMTHDGFFKSGDLGYMTPEGFVKIVDRKKDMILVSGFNVYPNEIEEVACMHEGVFEAAALGVPDEKSGEVVRLYIVKKDSNLTEQVVIDFCRQHLTAYKVPKQVVFMESLPKTNVGKILRRALRE